MTGISGLEQFRASYPQYSDLDDKTLGEALYQKYYSDTPKEEFDTTFYPVPPAPTFSDSLGAGVDFLQQAAGGLVAGIGNSIGSEAIEVYGKEVVDTNRKQIEEALGGSIDWRNIKNFKDFAQYASQTLGLNAAQMAYILGAGTAAQAVVPPIGVPGAIGKAGAFALGAGAAALPLFTGANISRQLEEGQDPQLGKAVASAIPQAATEMVFANILGRIASRVPFKPTPNVVSRVGKSIGEAITVGVPAEVIQQALERKAADLPVWIDNEEALAEYFDAGIGALLLSGTLGSGAEVINTAFAKKPEAPSVDPTKFEIPVGDTANIETTAVKSESPSESTALVPVGAPYNPPNFVKAQDETINNAVKVLQEDFGFTPEMIRSNSGNLVNSARELQLKRATRDISYEYEPILSVPNGTWIELSKGTKIPSNLDVKEEDGVVFIKSAKAEAVLTEKPKVYTQEELDKIRVAKEIGEEVAAELERNKIAAEREQLSEQEVKDTLEDTDKENEEVLAANRESLNKTLEAARETLFLSERSLDPSDARSLGLQRAVNHFVESAPEGSISSFEIQMALNSQGFDPTLSNIKEALNNILFNAPEKENVSPLLKKDDKGEYLRTSVRSPLQPRAQVTVMGPTEKLKEYYNKPGGERKYTFLRIKPEVADSPFVQNLSNFLKPILQDQAQVNFVDYIKEDDFHLSGLQWGNSLYVAFSYMGTPKTQADILNTAAHEAWHFVVDQTKVLTESDKALLERERPKLISFVAKKLGVEEGDIQNLVDSGKEGIEELQAYAFGYHVEDLAFEGMPAKSVFAKVDNFFRKLANFLKGVGFRTYEDLFANVQQGQYDLYQANLSTQQARAQRLYEDHLKMRGSQRASEGDALPVDQDYGHIEKLLRFLSTQPWKASKDPFFARMFNVFNAQSQTRNIYEVNYQRLLDPLLANKATFQVAGETMSYLRETGQPIEVDANGNLIYNRDGKRVALDSTISSQVVKLHELMRNALMDKISLARERLKDYNIPESTSIQDIQAEINDKNDLLTKMLELDSGDLSEVKLLNKQIEALELIRDFISELEAFIGSNNTYIPFMRFGDVGISVKNKETGELEEFISLEKNIFSGKHAQKEISKALDILKAKYSSKEYTVSEPFNLTKDNIINRLSNRLVTTELLSSLYAGGNDKTYAELVKEIQKDLSLRGFAKHFDKAKGTKGYSRDWERVVSSYLSASSMYNAQMKHGVDIAKIDSDIEQLRGNYRKGARDDFDYAISPVADMSGMRAANFLYTMGLNLSTAIINLITLPTSTASIMLQWDGNIVKHWGTLAKSYSDAVKLSLTGTDISKQEVSRIFSKENIDKYVKNKTLTPEEGQFLKVGSDRGIFQESLLEDALGSSAWSAQTQGGKTVRALKRTAAIAGWPVGYVEMTTRTASGLSIFKSLGSPEKLRYVREIYKEDARFNDWMSNLPEGVTEREGISMYATQEAHAVFNREGRGQLQRGVWGAFVTPFMTYPMQTLDLLAKQAFKRGAPGKAAAMYTMLAYFVMGGMMAIPGMELWKAIYEAYKRITGGTEVDMMNEIRKTLVEDAGIDPDTALSLVGGLSRTKLGIDISRRISLPLPMQNPLIALAEGNPDARAYLGVFGGLLGTTKAAYRGIAEGETPVGAFSKAIAPVAFRNMWKGLVEYTGAKGHGGSSTGTGLRLANPEDISVRDILRRTVGFTPSVEANQRELQRERQLQKTGYTVGLAGFRERVAKKTEEIHKEQRSERPDVTRINELRKEIQEERRRLAKWARDNDLVTDASFWNGFNTSVVNRVYQRINPKGVHKSQTNKNVDEQQIRRVFSVD